MHQGCGQLYASAATIGSTAYVPLSWTGVSEPVAALVSMTLVVAIRFAAVSLGTELPAPRTVSEKNRDED